MNWQSIDKFNLPDNVYALFFHSEFGHVLGSKFGDLFLGDEPVGEFEPEFFCELTNPS